MSATSNHFVRDLALPFLFGIVAAFAIMPFNIAAFAAVIGLVVVTYRSQGQFVWAALFTQCIVFCGVLMVAALVPQKTEELFLNKSVNLPLTEATLAELYDLAEQLKTTQSALPISVQFTFSQSDASNVIEFPGETITLGQFVRSIESQTALRHKFLHCGNGWTIARGGDCQFGLAIRDPELVGPQPYPRDVYQPPD